MYTTSTADREIHALIKDRKSIRAFDSKPIPEAEVHKLFEAARWAASSMNEQPWRFILADRSKNAAWFELILSTLNESNRVWAKEGAMLTVVLSRKNFTHNGLPNKHAMHDTGLAISNLSIQATAAGIYLHQMGGFDNEKLRTALQIDPLFEIVSVLVLGYPGKVDQLPAHLQERELKPRVRKPLDQIVYVAQTPSE
jgi:nitroreductase